MQRRALFTGLAATACVAGLPRPALAAGASIAFDGAWRPLTFRGIPATAYALGGDRLEVRAAASSSLIWRPVPEAARGAARASWDWRVSVSVPPTDLSRKGGDDRNLALYFVLADPDTAARLSPEVPLGRLLANRALRTLIYVWGGQDAPGTLIPSPYMRGRGSSVVLRAAAPGAASESVDLSRDHARAFGDGEVRLVGLAVSSDADDTGSRAEGAIAGLRLG